jgi:hypothetical protein
MKPYLLYVRHVWFGCYEVSFMAWIFFMGAYIASLFKEETFIFGLIGMLATFLLLPLVVMMMKKYELDHPLR